MRPINLKHHIIAKQSLPDSLCGAITSNWGVCPKPAEYTSLSSFIGKLKELDSPFDDHLFQLLADVPAELQWAKDMFVLNCALGCRIGDLKKLSKALRRLLEFCGIDRPVCLYDPEVGDNVYRPLYEMASSKLACKTHVDMLNKVQINYYAAGQHREGAKGAFGEEEYWV